MSLGAVLLRPVITVGPGRHGHLVDIVFVVISFFFISTLFTSCRCETNIDECQILPNCQNNGTCTDMVNGYNCTCTEKFTGDNCEFKVSIDYLFKFG